MESERIVCAAIKLDESIITGVRHYDKNMMAIIHELNGDKPIEESPWVKAKQGFITNKYRFVTREEAWAIAKSQDQIYWGKDRPPGPLFSEDLY